MPVVGKYLFRKLIYTVAGVGTVAAGAYLTGHHDIGEWTARGLAGAAASGIWGAILSGFLGGALSSKN